MKIIKRYTLEDIDNANFLSEHADPDIQINTKFVVAGRYDELEQQAEQLQKRIKDLEIELKETKQCPVYQADTQSNDERKSIRAPSYKEVRDRKEQRFLSK